MKVVVLAGGRGTRLGGSAAPYPKALAPIGDKPILWHLLTHFSHYGLSDFVIAIGDRGEAIREYFAALHLGNSAVKLHTRTGDWEALDENSDTLPSPDWSVELIPTGIETQTGGRIARVMPYLDDEPFLLTWCDALSDLNPHDLINTHRAQPAVVTMMTVPMPARFGHVETVGNQVLQFQEKPQGREGRISAGTFVVDRQIRSMNLDDHTDWDKEILPRLAQRQDLNAYHHDGFWQCMDTIDEQQRLSERWARGSAPWQTHEPHQPRINVHRQVPDRNRRIDSCGY